VIVFIDIVLLTLLVATAISLVRLRNLIATIMLTGIFSLLSACLFMTMDAVDVAFTEAAVGAGLTTVLMLSALVLIGREEKVPGKGSVLPFLVVLITGFVLVYGTMDMPHFGSPDAPIHQHLADRYLEKSGGPDGEVGPPNVVTSVLASYRGYDTMGEVAVIFTAAVGVMLLLGVGFASKRKDEP
jgi:multicomponent Na+:H+ antiporter subunit B